MFSNYIETTLAPVHLPEMTENDHKLKYAFDEYFELLVLNAQKYVSVFEDAEEIVQDVYVKLNEQMDNLPHDIDIKAYLYRAVSNSCMNYLKHKKVVEEYRAQSKNNATKNLIEDNNAIESQEIIEAINNAINDLPDHWREVFILNRFEGLKYKEIATKLNISPKTVEKYMSKSLRQLQVELKDIFH